MFPITRLPIESVVPMYEVPLSIGEMGRIIVELPPPPGIGKTALEYARKEQEHVLRRTLGEARLLSDQVPFGRIKEVFRDTTPLLVLESSIRKDEEDLRRLEEERKRTGEGQIRTLLVGEYLALETELKEQYAKAQRLADELQTRLREAIRQVATEHKIKLEEKELKDIFSRFAEEKGNPAPLFAPVHAALSTIELTKVDSKGKTSKVNISRVIDERILKEFTDKLVERYVYAFVQPGSTVGILAGQAIGGPALQASLSAFHFAGSKSGTSDSFARIQSILYASKDNKDPHMTLSFIDLKELPLDEDMHSVLHAGTFESILAKRRFIEETTVADVVTSARLLDTREYAEADIASLVAMHRLIRPRSFEKIIIDNPAYVMELTLNLFRMYTHHISMENVARAIEGPGDGRKDDSIACAWGSQSVKKSPRNGKMYVLCNECKSWGMGSMDKSSAIMQFLNNSIRAKFRSYHISGIRGITRLIPLKRDVLDVVSTTRGVPGKWHVYVKSLMTRLDGISMADLVRLFRAAGYTFASRPWNTKDLFIEVLGKEEVKAEPVDYVRSIDKKDPAYERIQQYRYIYMAATDGINVEEIVWLEDLDTFRFHVNDIHIMEDYFGIDITRFYLIEEFSRILGVHSQYINKRHISLLFDFMLNPGLINPITYSGVRRSGVGPLVMASFERAMNIFAEAASMGKRETLDRISSSLYYGTLAPYVGTGMVNLVEKPGVMEDAKEAIRSDEDIAIESVEGKRVQFKEESEPPIEEEKLRRIPVEEKKAHPPLSEGKVELLPTSSLTLVSPSLQSSLFDPLAGSEFDPEARAAEYEVAVQPSRKGPPERKISRAEGAFEEKGPHIRPTQEPPVRRGPLTRALPERKGPITRPTREPPERRGPMTRPTREPPERKVPVPREPSPELPPVEILPVEPPLPLLPLPQVALGEYFPRTYRPINLLALQGK